MRGIHFPRLQQGVSRTSSASPKSSDITRASGFTPKFTCGAGLERRAPGTAHSASSSSATLPTGTANSEETAASRECCSQPSSTQKRKEIKVALHFPRDTDSCQRQSKTSWLSSSTKHQFYHPQQQT